MKILTKDSVTVFVNAIMYYKVKNAIHAVANVDDYSGSARLLAATTLRNVLGTMTLGDILCQILTKDSVTVFVNAIMYYKVKDAIHAVANVDDYSGSARLLAATTLRNVLGTLTLGEILSQRESIAKDMRVSLERSLTFSLIFFYEFSKILMLQRSPGELRWRGWR